MVKIQKVTKSNTLLSKTQYLVTKSEILVITQSNVQLSPGEREAAKKYKSACVKYTTVLWH